MAINGQNGLQLNDTINSNGLLPWPEFYQTCLYWYLNILLFKPKEAHQNHSDGQ